MTTSAAHSTITDPYIHEPKGIAAAAINKVYVANGSGSGTWQKLTTAQFDTTSTFNTNKYILNYKFTDVSTVATQDMVIPVTGTITKIYAVLEGAITVTDLVFTFKNNAGGSMGTITLAQSGSAVGTNGSLTPVSNNTFTAGDLFQIAGAGTTGAKDVQITFLVTQTA